MFEAAAPGSKIRSLITFPCSRCEAPCSWRAKRSAGSPPASTTFPRRRSSNIDNHYIVLDHTPLVGASAGAAYRWREYQFTFDGLFSSGLRGGFANEQQLPKVCRFNLSGARDFNVPGLGRVTDRIILLNIFDRTNLIRPATGIGVFQACLRPQNHRVRRADRAVALTLDLRQTQRTNAVPENGLFDRKISTPYGRADRRCRFGGGSDLVGGDGERTSIYCGQRESVRKHSDQRFAAG